jgi:hypothetical protein
MPIQPNGCSNSAAAPLDPELNAAILHIARRLFCCGFDISDQAPGTYAELRAHLDAGNRMVVYAGGCENTIYADPAVNHAFRAWHDWCHWRGEHDFSVAGETAVYHIQCQHLVMLYGDTPATRRWRDILYAEIVGQRLYYETHKRYVDDQRAFVEQFLARMPSTIPTSETTGGATP